MGIMMSDETTGQREQADQTEDLGNTAQPRRGGGLAALAILLSLIAIGLAGFPYYQQRVTEPPPQQPNGELEALRTTQQRQADELKRLDAGIADFETRLKQQQASIDAQSARVPEEVAPTPLSPMPERALKLGEVAFLLRSANDRLLVTHDAQAALTMLLAAQSLVGELDDQALGDVREALSSEIASLRAVSSVDFDATIQSLQAIESAIPALPVRGARFVPSASTAEPEPASTSVSATVWRKFSSLFEFRREGTARPPLGPDAAAYLRLNTATMVQMAELALLRNDGVVYQHSLESVRRWLDDYFDTGAQDVTNLRSQVERLAAVKIDRSMPDISGSLAALRRVDASAAPDAGAEPGASNDAAAPAAVSGENP